MALKLSSCLSKVLVVLIQAREPDWKKRAPQYEASRSLERVFKVFWSSPISGHKKVLLVLIQAGARWGKERGIRIGEWRMGN